MKLNELHERLDKEHTDALLTNYSGDYEVWLEERIAQLESSLVIEKQKHLDTANWAEEQQSRADGMESSLAEAREERDSFILMYQMSVKPVDVPHEEIVKAHRIVKEFFEAEKK